MKNRNKIDTVYGKLVYPLKSALFQVYMLFGTFITMYLAKIGSYLPIGIVGFIIFFILPAIFSKHIRNHYTKKAKISFNESGLIIALFNTRTDRLEKQIFYKYSEIKGCKLNHKQDLYSSIIFIFNSGASDRLTFIDEASEADSSAIVYHQLLLHGGNLSESKMITIDPIYQASKKSIYMNKLYNDQFNIRAISVLRIFNRYIKYLLDPNGLQDQIQNTRQQLQTNSQNIELAFKYLDGISAEKEKPKPRKRKRHK